MTDSTWAGLDAMFSRFPIMRGEAASEEQVRDASRRLGVEFEPGYVEFLLRYGGAMVGADPVFGLSPVEVLGDRFWSVVDVTEDFRSQGWPGTRTSYVVSMDGRGNPILVSPGGRVRSWDRDSATEYEVAPSFESFLDRLAAGTRN